MVNCKNCNIIVDTKHCSNCGLAVALKRIDHHYILHEIEHVLHFEKGFFYTVKVLLLQPAKNIKAYITDDRNKLIKPILFLIVTSLIYTLITHFFHLEDGYFKFDNTQATNSAAAAVSNHLISNWIQNHYGYANIVMGIFIALWLKLFFKKYAYNLFEILILLCFVMGVAMFSHAFFSIIEGLSKLHIMKISAILSSLYTCWAIGQFFEEKKIMSYVKAFMAYALGMFTFALSILLLDYVLQKLV